MIRRRLLQKRLESGLKQAVKQAQNGFQTEFVDMSLSQTESGLSQLSLSCWVRVGSGWLDLIAARNWLDSELAAQISSASRWRQRLEPAKTWRDQTESIVFSSIEPNIVLDLENGSDLRCSSPCKL